MPHHLLSTAAPAPQFQDSLGRTLVSTSRLMALSGGVILVGLAVMLTVTIAARKLFAWQVAGDHEIVRMFAAVSVSMLFPWCQITGANIVVDLLTSRLSGRAARRLDQIGALALGAVALLLTWRTGALMLESKASGSFSPLLAWPVWIFQALMLPGLLLTGVCGLYLALAPGAMQARTRFTHDIGASE